VFTSLTHDPTVIPFLVKITQTIPELRVPFVSAGLIEQILPTIGSNCDHLALLSALVSEAQSREYFSEMDHFPKLISVLFESGVSYLATRAFRALLDSADVLNLNRLQERLYELNVPRQLALTISQNLLSDDSIQNAILCLADCIQDFPLSSLPFSVDVLIKIVVERPRLEKAVLYLFENLSISNPHLFPTDDIFQARSVMPRSPAFLLFMSYLAFDCHRRSTLDLSLFDIMRSPLVLVLGIQRRLFLRQAVFLAQNQENEVL
jgi:hypothetical protein